MMTGLALVKRVGGRSRWTVDPRALSSDTGRIDFFFFFFLTFIGNIIDF